MAFVIIFGVVMVLYLLLFASFIIGSCVTMIDGVVNKKSAQNDETVSNNSYDFWDEPDMGTYVTMPNGDVRID
jgi:PBP1b-binding outer membrane lipoprotein LpoB